MSTNDSNFCPNLTKEEIVKFKETFIQFDPNGSGDENTATINIKDYNNYNKNHLNTNIIITTIDATKFESTIIIIAIDGT